MSRQALLIVDMQQGLFGPPSDGAELVARLNALSGRMRAQNSPVIFIQHCGAEGDGLHPSQPGHALHAGLTVAPDDTIVPKKSCDAFLDTDLASILSEQAIDELVVTGFATDFCVDTTIRSALARGFRTIVPEDGHTTSDRHYSTADKVIEHHNFVWANLLSPAGAAQLTRCDAVP